MFFKNLEEKRNIHKNENRLLVRNNTRKKSSVTSLKYWKKNLSTGNSIPSENFCQTEGKMKTF